MAITRQLVDFCQSVDYDDIPEEVIDRCKYFTLDFLGVALRGSLVDSTRAMYAVVEDLGLAP
ncbi:MAG: MmgE/PrpD family protein, partial [Deltaproteobacteria bacterium]